MIHKQPLVSIVIPTYNRERMLQRLIRSIVKSSYLNIEIIVIDDASLDKTYENIKKKYKNIKLIRNKKNLFAAASRNVGLKKTKGKYIFFIDDDNTLDRNTISSLVDAFESDDTLGEVGPVNYSYANKKKIVWSQTKRNMFTSKTNQARDLKKFDNFASWETDDIPNAYMVRTSVVKGNKIFFREKFGIMYEESDYAYRIRKAGYKIKVIRRGKIYHDIEGKTKNGQMMDYMHHFMTDMRRPYVIARNRIIFHAMYSNKLQFICILFIWIWIFAIYYFYKIIFYSGVGSFSVTRRMKLVISYIHGIISGLLFVISNRAYT